MILATATLKSAAPYSQSKHVTAEKQDKEGHDAYERRTWPQRMHVTDDGMVQIPPMAFKNALQAAAKYLAIQIPGQGKARYTKHFEAGVLVLEHLVLGLKAEDVQAEELFVPSDGKPGGGSRVTKFFPLIPDWDGEVLFHVLDHTITEAVFRRVLEGAGQFVGIGRFRPENRGYYGRFSVEDIEWAEIEPSGQ